MRIVARRRQGYAHDVELEGHDLRVDAGPRPTQLLGASLAGCIAITVEMYANRKGWDVGPVEVDVEMSYEGPVPTDFEVGLKLPGHLDAEQKRRLLIIAT